MNAALEWAATVDPRWPLLTFLVLLNLWSTGLVILSAAPRREKALWVAVIFLCPIIGGVLWFVFGPKPWAGRRG
ncbi:PLD nuclease N-terminal domain-containing protein [Candidatus Palauibacter sp.]|uniref:PLD nuclease N-terminal domain-containing protein n=1 Tax=Candidatus Palauibacter sp. TaxID=3101350 RepID=UPI003AF2686E